MSIKDNIQYQQMKVTPDTYVPDFGMEYPTDDPYARLVPAPITRPITIDENYPYLDDSLSYKIQRWMVYTFLAFGPLFLVNKLLYGVRFEGRDILKKYKKEFKDGIMIVSNHCYKLDGMSISEALRHRLWIPMLKDHFLGPNWWMLTYFGGIPVPEDIASLRKFNEAFDELHRRKKWILIFPEARSWFFYKPLKPFKKGAFTMAYKYKCPILPMNLSYRPRTGIHKLFCNPQTPLITVKIGEPIFPDTTKPRKEEVENLCIKSHKAICDMAGIIENPWPATWNEN